ncbi:MAG: SIS domain-containing protein, partial [Vampirovibrionia bacterium]
MADKYYMWNELNEVPALIKKGLSSSNVIIPNSDKEFNINNFSNIKLIASGSSNNVAHSGRFALEELIHKPISVEYASEFAHRNFCLDERTLVIPISQSGKTADTLYAIKKIKEKTNCQILSITNVKDSPIYKLSNYNVLIKAGIEKAVPATKTFSMQLLSLLNFAFSVTDKNHINPEYLKQVEDDLKMLPDIITKVISMKDEF